MWTMRQLHLVEEHRVDLGKGNVTHTKGNCFDTLIVVLAVIIFVLELLSVQFVI
jgi:hypothetical protein